MSVNFLLKQLAVDAQQLGLLLPAQATLSDRADRTKCSSAALASYPSPH
jgi:hypothetical protein